MRPENKIRQLGLPIAALSLFVALCAAGCKKDASPPNPNAKGTVQGRISVSQGPWVVGEVKVEIFAAKSQPPVATLNAKLEDPSEAQGRRQSAAFTLTDLKPGDYTIRATAMQRAPAVLALSLRPGETLNTVLRLELAQELRGRVVDGASQGVPKAQIHVWTDSTQRLPARQTTADEEGNFVVSNLAPGRVSLLVESAGLGTVQKDDVLVPGKSLSFQLEGIGQTLIGQIAGAEEAGAMNVVLGGETLAGARHGKADDKGGFIFRGLGPGTYGVRASNGKLATAEVSVEVRDGQVHPGHVALQAVRGEIVSGRVTNDRGTAISKAEVVITADPLGQCPEELFSDVVGYVASSALAPGTYRVTARAPGHGSPPALVVQLNGPISPLPLVLPRATRIEGRVVGPQGRALADARVTVLYEVATTVPLPRDRIPVLSGDLPLAAAAARSPSSHQPLQVDGKNATTDSLGNFVIDVAPGALRLEVQHPGFLSGIVSLDRVSAGQTRKLADIAMAQGVQVIGRVVNERGAPVPGAEIHRMVGQSPGVSANSAPSSSLVVTKSDAEGRFALRWGPGHHWLYARGEGIASMGANLVNVPQAATHEVFETVLHVRSDLRDLRGEVSDAKGRGLVGLPITAIAQDKKGSPPIEIARALSEKGGRFVLTGLPQTDLIIQTRDNNLGPVSMALRAPIESPWPDLVRLRFFQPGGIEGEIVEAPSGRFLSNAKLFLSTPGGAPGPPVKTTGAGFRLLGLPPGPWVLSATAPGFVEWKKNIDVPAGEDSQKASLAGIKVEMQRL